MALNTLVKVGAIAAAVMGAGAVHAQEFITIGTGSVTGVYYPTGGAICKLINKDRRDHNIRCSVESTGGSIYNVNTIRSGELDFGIVQSDWQYHGYKGTSTFEEQGPYTKLRAMFSLHTEPFNIIARSDAGIEKLEDLKGKRVNIGNPGSGDYATMSVVMDAMGWTQDTFKLASELKALSALKHYVITRSTRSSTWSDTQMAPLRKPLPRATQNWFPQQVHKSTKLLPRDHIMLTPPCQLTCIAAQKKT